MTSGGGSRFHENTGWSFSTTVATLPSTTTCSKEIGTRKEVERYIGSLVPSQPKATVTQTELDPSHRVKNVRIVDERLCIDPEDGQTVSVLVEIYPRIANGTDEQRANWQLIRSGLGIHRPDLDENIDTFAFLSGTRP